MKWPPSPSRQPVKSASATNSPSASVRTISPSPTPRPIRGKVGLIERLGNETIVSLNLPSDRNLIAALDGDANIALGQDLALGFAPDKAVLFDANGEAIPLP